MLEVREITPRGVGAVSTLRVRGQAARAAVERLCGVPLTVGTLKLVRLSIDGEDLDQALVAVLGAEEVEVCLHGSPPLVARLVEHFSAAAQREPARTLEQRAAERLARAPCEAAARILLDQAEGALRDALEPLCELDLSERAAAIDRLLARWRTARFALEPARVVVAGPVNAGKSTLFNALLGRRRTIESEEPGTTRDVICEPALLGAYSVWLFDTAGERALGLSPARTFEVERAGQERGRLARDSADLVLWLEPAAAGAARPASTDASAPIVRVASLADRLDPESLALIPNALSTRADPEGARALVVRLFQRQFDLPDEPWTPGLAVPFEAELAQELAELRAVPDRAVCARRIGRLVAGD